MQVHAMQLQLRRFRARIGHGSDTDRARIERGLRSYCTKSTNARAKVSKRAMEI